MTMLARVLRAAAVIIALLGLIDPAISLPWPDRAHVAVRALSAADDALAQRVRARLARDFDVATTVNEATRALVLVGDDASPDANEAQLDDVLLRAAAGGVVNGDAARADGHASTPPLALVAVQPAASAAPRPGVAIRHVSAPRTLHVASQLRVRVDLAAHGRRGRSSTIVLRAGGLQLARATHAWQQDDEQATVMLEATPIAAGLAQLTVDASDASTSSATPAVVADRADLAVDVTTQPIRVLFVDARPSWTTRFIRLALESDPRFRLDSRAQVSRGLTSRTADAPPRVTLSTLSPFDVLIVGGPELLDAGELQALRAFARARGGAIIFAPDRAPQGSYVDLLPVDRVDERLLDAPLPIVPGAVLAPDRATPTGAQPDAPAGSKDAAKPAALLAAELALPRALRPGATTLAEVALDGRQRPAIVSSPLGDGDVIFAGALDAWRYRDRDGGQFDRLWRQLVSTYGAQAPPPIDVTLDPVLARPGEPITFRAVWRRDLADDRASGDAANATVPVSVRARIAPVPASHPNAGAVALVGVASGGGSAAANDRPGTAPTDDNAIRVWPGDRPGLFRGVLNAPAGAGVYAVSIDADSSSMHASVPLLVSADVHRARRAWDGLRARVEALGGLVVSDAQLDRAADHVRRRVAADAGRAPRHPWRSAWWIVPFAACLGGEWLVRRRRGEA